MGLQYSWVAPVMQYMEHPQGAARKLSQFWGKAQDEVWNTVQAKNHMYYYIFEYS